MVAWDLERFLSEYVDASWPYKTVTEVLEAMISIPTNTKEDQKELLSSVAANLLSTSSWMDAEALFVKAWLLDRTDSDTLETLAKYYYHFKPQDYIKIFKLLVSKVSASPQHLLDLAATYMRLEKVERGLLILKKITSSSVEDAPESMKPWDSMNFNVGVCFLRQRNWSRMESHFLQTFEIFNDEKADHILPFAISKLLSLRHSKAHDLDRRDDLLLIHSLFCAALRDDRSRLQRSLPAVVAGMLIRLLVHPPMDRLLGNKALFATILRSHPFIPRTYILPQEWNDFLSSESGNPESWWILKHADLSNGNGMSLYPSRADVVGAISQYIPTSSDSDVNTEETPRKQFVLQSYIVDPLLYQGVKIDMRVYAMIAGSHPVRVYLYRDGLIRSATAPYAQSRYSAFTLQAHKTGPAGSSIRRLSEFFRIGGSTHNSSHEMIWAKIQHVVTSGVLSVHSKTSSLSSSFDLDPCISRVYGMDIMVDISGNVWLLEANTACNMWSFFPQFEQDLFLAIGTDISRMTCARAFAEQRCDFPPDSALDLSYTRDDQKNLSLRFESIYSEIQTCEETLVIGSDVTRNELNDFCRYRATEMAVEFLHRGGFQLVFPLSEQSDILTPMQTHPNGLVEPSIEGFDLFSNQDLLALQLFKTWLQNKNPKKT